MIPRSFHLVSLGCKVNQHEGQGIRERLIAHGYSEVELAERPGVVIINTCTVTARADEKCRKAVRRARRSSPEATLIVTGCAAVTSPEVHRAMPEVDLVLTKSRMARVESVLVGGAPREGDVFNLRISAFAGHTRAFLKVQDGCDAFCAYCIVPYARGAPRSRPLSEIAEEVRRLVDHGHREIVLTGIHLGLYGRDLGAAGLCDAVRAALSVRGLARLRLSSIEGPEVPGELLDLMADEPRLCPHLHLPLQSGDDDVLAAMNRRYTSGAFLNVVEEARRRLDRPAITTDLMVGFPGESDAQFENSMRVCREAAFSRMHVFRYSPRPGTPAAEREPVPASVAREREIRALALARELALDYRRGFVGQEVMPLVEARRDRETGHLAGFTPRYVTVRFPGPDEWMNHFVPVHVTSADDEGLTGDVSEG